MKTTKTSCPRGKTPNTETPRRLFFQKKRSRSKVMTDSNIHPSLRFLSVKVDRNCPKGKKYLNRPLITRAKHVPSCVTPSSWDGCSCFGVISVDCIVACGMFCFSALFCCAAVNNFKTKIWKQMIPQISFPKNHETKNSSTLLGAYLQRHPRTTPTKMIPFLLFLLEKLFW